ALGDSICTMTGGGGASLSGGPRKMTSAVVTPNAAARRIIRRAVPGGPFFAGVMGMEPLAATAEAAIGAGRIDDVVGERFAGGFAKGSAETIGERARPDFAASKEDEGAGNGAAASAGKAAGAMGSGAG